MAEFRTLRAGIFLPPFHPNDEDPLLCMERDFELMQWLDKLDYAEAWIGEHHSGGYEIYGQPELFIATAAERTRRIRLGTGVISLPYHHPLMVAGRIVQLDYQTRGRAMFGFGPGLLPSDAMMLGIDPETQRDRMADAIDVITRLLAGEIITQETDWYRMREARLHLRPYTKPRPHLAITSSVTPSGGKLAGRYDLGMICVMAGSPHGYDALDYNWQLACAEAAAQGRVMDRVNYRVMAPFHIAETREKAIENVRAGFEKWQLYSYSVNPEGGAAIGMPSIEAINEGGRGAIGTPDDALRVLENYWTKTGGFGCIVLLAHDWADWEATKRSYELFARYVLPGFEERNAWRSQSMDWMRANREAFSAKRKTAQVHAVERHFAEEQRKKGMEAAK
jgi:limonene 1,2-monooxygenase